MFTVPIQLGLGYLIAKGIGTQKSADLLQTMLAVAIVILAVMLGLAAWRKFKATQRRSPRAKARWLRQFRIRHSRPTAEQ